MAHGGDKDMFEVWWTDPASVLALSHTTHHFRVTPPSLPAQAAAEAPNEPKMAPGKPLFSRRILGNRGPMQSALDRF